ncbi:DUF488 domain-containing protein [Tetragenococcus muriaticus]|uniref:YeaO family protein n=1 Tax=Tetragenococcus muriaticus 3MR10-3 TaxID=1302648 RepID=A0A091CEM9_9ENTE|nr:DUF488 family protein [Tetragenococcus muriaticus]KFN93103.1 hypothetical protein TMU3MR103_0124 [Tetragenococcus muriaticus 3MR10-3]
MPQVKLIRAYDHQKVRHNKGYKILVDRLWPRGVSKSELPYEWWLKELAPSNELRSWFDHQDERYPKFKRKYLDEIEANSLSKPVLSFLKNIIKDEDIILIYGAKNEKYNQAVVLKDWLDSNFK